MTQMELMPYSPEEQAVVDEQHHNKPEINHRHSAGLTVIAYWLRQHNICTIYVQTEDGAAEFVVPNDKVGDYFEHPFSHKDAIIRNENE